MTKRTHKNALVKPQKLPPFTSSLPKTDEISFVRSCIESAKEGHFESLFDSHLKPQDGIENIRDPEDDGNSLLHIACLNKQLHLAEALLSISGLFHVDLQNNSGNTSLHLVIARDASYIPIIECLITNYSASPFTRNHDGETPQFLLSFSQFGLQRIPDLNQLLLMHTFRQNKEDVLSIGTTHECSLRSTVKSKISRMSPQSLLVYRQIYRTLTNGSVWLRREHLFKIFDQLNHQLFDQELKQILNTIDINNDGHVDFEDFLAFLLVPSEEWTKTVMSKRKQDRNGERAKAFAKSMYIAPLQHTGILEDNEKLKSVQIGKEDYHRMDAALGKIFSCSHDETDFVFSSIFEAVGLDKPENDGPMQLDGSIWKMIADNTITIDRKVKTKETQERERRGST